MMMVYPPPRSRLFAWALGVSLAWTSGAVAAKLEAQNLQPGTTLNDLGAARSGQAQAAREKTVGAQLIYGNNLLQLSDRVTGEQWGLVAHRLDLALSFVEGLDPTWFKGLGADIALTVPVVLLQYQEVQLDQYELYEKSKSTTAMGDPRLQARLQILDHERDGADVALLTTLSVPWPGDRDYVGNESVTITPAIAVSAPLESFTAVLNVGWTIRENAYVDGLWITDQLLWRLGAAYDLAALGAPEDSAMMLELYGLTRGTRPFRSTRQSPTEWLASIRYRVGDFVLNAGGGGGLTQGYATPTVRGVLGLSWAPRRHDADGDGVVDSMDECPKSAEDEDGFADDDGCPDIDNDGDTIPDAIDRCPHGAEDLDGYQDGDGCPDRDNDDDGIPDEEDLCQNASEDLDGYQDADGCPEADNDGDGIEDANDSCPDEPETPNDFQDEDGCPDASGETDNPEPTEQPPATDEGSPPAEPESQEGTETTDDRGARSGQGIAT